MKKFFGDISILLSRQKSALKDIAMFVFTPFERHENNLCASAPLRTLRETCNGRIEQPLLHILPFLVMFSCSKPPINEPEFERNPANDTYKEAFHDGMREKMIGHHEKALPFFEKCLQLSPNNAAVHFALSEIYEETGQKSLSTEFAEKAQTLDKENKWYILRLAHIYFDRGDFQKSAAHFELIIKDEKNLDLKFKYAEALIQSQQHKKAIAMLNEIEVETGKAPELSLAKHELYLGLRDEESAENELRALIEDDPSNIQNLMIVTEYYLNTNQPQKAEKLILDGLRTNPEAGELYVLSADLKLRKGQIDPAFVDLGNGFRCDDMPLNRKLELIWGLMPYAFNASNPDGKSVQTKMQGLFDLLYDETLQSDRLHHHYGTFLQKTGKKSEAVHQFKLVCDINPDSYESWNQLLKLECDLEMYAYLLQDGPKAIELFPTQPEFYLMAGIGAYESGKFTEAEEWLFLGKDLVVDNKKLSSDFLFHLGQLRCKDGKTDQGISYFDQAIQQQPDNAAVYYQKYLNLIIIGRNAEAENALVEGLNVKPDDADLLDASGLILLQKKSYTDAVRIFERALMSNVFNGVILEHYGDALFLSGEQDKALQIWNEAKNNGNTSDLLKKKIAEKKYHAN